MSPAHLHTLSCYLLRMQALRPSETLFVEGSLGQSVYILQAGQLKAVAAVADPSPLRPSAEGKVLHVFKDSNPDDRIFGEIALIMDIPRTASIISMSHSIVLEWKREDYRTFLSLSSSQTQHIQRMMKARTAEHFRKYKVPFFASIPDEKYAILASLCQVEERREGEVIFKEGEKGNQFYLIAYGEVRVTMKRKKKAGDPAPPTAAGDATQTDSAEPIGPSAASDSTSVASPSGGTYATIRGTMRGTWKQRWGTLRRRPPMDFDGGAKGPLSPSDVDSVEICRMGPGKYFGEIALVQDTPRTATVTALSRCIILSITKENFQIFFHEAPEAISDFEIKLARYDVALRSVLYHPLGLLYFKRHCEREYAGENVDFWLRCRDFRHLTMEGLGKEREEKRLQRREERLAREKKSNPSRAHDGDKIAQGLGQGRAQGPHQR